MQEQQRASLADHVLLAGDVLIAPQRHLADLAQVSAGDEPGAAHRPGHLVGIVHDLDVEGLARVDGAVLVGVLAHALAARRRVIGGRKGDVQEVVVEHRIIAQQALQGAAHQRQIQHPGDGAALGISLAERRARCDLRDRIGRQGLAVGLHQALAGLRLGHLARLGHELCVDVVGHNRVEPQEALGHEPRHLGGTQKGRGRGHVSACTSCSNQNSYFR